MSYPDQVRGAAASASSLLDSMRALAIDVGKSGDQLAGAELARVRHDLTLTLDSLNEAIVIARDARDRCDVALAAWEAQIRFTPHGREATIARLRAMSSEHPATAGRALLTEVAAAVNALAVAHAIALLRDFSHWLPLPDGVLEDLVAWHDDGDLPRGREAVRVLSTLSRQKRAGGATVTLLALTEAWLSYTVGDLATAADILDRLVERSPADPLLRVERSGIYLILGDKESSADDAHRAIELDDRNAECYIQAGAVAEASAEYAEAVELYMEAVTAPGSARFTGPRAVSFVQRTGLFYLAWARALQQSGSTREALHVVDRALVTRVAGTSTYPEAAAYDLKWRLLRALDEPLDVVASAAFDAGLRHQWNDDLDHAIDAFRAAVEGGAAVPQAGWHLADALQHASAGLNRDRLVEAADVWDHWKTDFGPPSPDEAAAYANRGVIGEFLADINDSNRTAAAWSGVLLCEKGLVLNSFDTYSWGQLGRFYRELSMLRLALEAVEAGYSTDPDDQTVLGQRAAVLADLGRTQEALDTLERVRPAKPDPWLSDLKALLLLRSGRPTESLECLELPLFGKRDVGQYRKTRAACLVDLRRFDEAVDELAGVTRELAGQTGRDRCARAYAFAMIGDLAAAERELEAAMHDQGLGAADRAGASFWVALAGQNPHGALGHLQKVFALAPAAARVDITLREVERTLSLLEHIGRPVDHAAKLLLRARRIAGEQKPAVQDADRELDTATQDGAEMATDPVQQLALVATRARRLIRQGRPHDAAQLYQQLRGTDFDPEATRGLGQALEDELRQMIRRGDVHATRVVYERLALMDRAPTPFVDVAIAEALRSREDNATAVNTLSALAPSVLTTDERLRVLELLGESALFAGMPEVAEPALMEAFDLAASTGDASRAAQICVRLALAVAHLGAWNRVTEHLACALEQWVTADTWDPRGILELELRWLVEAIPGGLSSADRHRLRDAVDRAASVSAIENRGEPGDEEGTEKEIKRLAQFLWEHDSNREGDAREHWFLANQLVRRGHDVAGYTENDVARLAHFMWERRGRPEGQDRKHWFRARQLIRVGVDYVEAGSP